MVSSARRFTNVFYVAPAALLTCAVVATSLNCAPGPLSKPTVARPSSNPVAINGEAGTGALEMARRQLQGSWDLVSLELVPPGAKTQGLVKIQATATLTYDDYGNLTIEGRTTDPNAPPAMLEANLLTFKGRAVIDVTNHELKMMNLTGNVDPNEALAPERRRRYELTANDLKLSSLDEQGKVTMVSTWKRKD
jgi:hypothetical protein